MACIATDRNGSRRILFVAPDGSRKAIRLGAVPLRLAESFRLRVEALVSARLAGTPVDAENSPLAWRPSGPNLRPSGAGRAGRSPGRGP